MNKRYFIGYFLILAIFVGLVIVKQKSITKKNQKEIVTFYTNWKSSGKPVVVQKVQRCNLDSILKMTLTPESENTYIGYLPKIYLQGLSLESSVFIHYQNRKIPCKIVEIGKNIHFDTGMYPIKIFCSEKIENINSKYFAEAEINGLKDVVILPHDSIAMENNKSFVWIVKDGQAHKQFIILNDRNRNGIVAQGLDEKDLIIIKGAASLKENDLINLNYEK